MANDDMFTPRSVIFSGASCRKTAPSARIDCRLRAVRNSQTHGYPPYDRRDHMLFYQLITGTHGRRHLFLRGEFVYVVLQIPGPKHGRVNTSIIPRMQGASMNSHRFQPDSINIRGSFRFRCMFHSVIKASPFGSGLQRGFHRPLNQRGRQRRMPPK